MQKSVEMRDSIRDRSSRWSISACLYVVLSVLLAGIYTSCETVGPSPSPERYYNLGESQVVVEAAAGEIEISPFDNSPAGKLPLVFIREDTSLTYGEFYQFENRIYDLGSIYGGLDVMTYCLEMGLEEFPCSKDFYVPYKWVEVSSFQSASGVAPTVNVRYKENTSREFRSMCIHFFNGEWGLLIVNQKPAS